MLWTKLISLQSIFCTVELQYSVCTIQGYTLRIQYFGHVGAQFPCNHFTSSTYQWPRHIALLVTGNNFKESLIISCTKHTALQPLNTMSKTSHTSYNPSPRLPARHMHTECLPQSQGKSHGEKNFITRCPLVCTCKALRRSVPRQHYD